MMAFVKVSSIAAPLMLPNVDTDAIVPSREYQSTATTGFGEKLFANWRYVPGTRTEIPDFILNKEPFRRACILVSGPNFGCGSSREWAVWGLTQFGIRCVIAESFGNIFRQNAVRNGLLTVALKASEIEHIARLIQDGDPVTVDLESCVVTAPDGAAFSFEIDAKERQMLLRGLDEIDLTQTHAPAIGEFVSQDSNDRPWLYAVDR